MTHSKSTNSGSARSGKPSLATTAGSDLGFDVAKAVK